MIAPLSAACTGRSTLAWSGRASARLSASARSCRGPRTLRRRASAAPGRPRPTRRRAAKERRRRRRRRKKKIHARVLHHHLDRRPHRTSRSSSPWPRACSQRRLSSRAARVRCGSCQCADAPPAGYSSSGRWSRPRARGASASARARAGTQPRARRRSPRARRRGRRRERRRGQSWQSWPSKTSTMTPDTTFSLFKSEGKKKEKKTRVSTVQYRVLYPGTVTYATREKVGPSLCLSVYWFNNQGWEYPGKVPGKVPGTVLY